MRVRTVKRPLLAFVPLAALAMSAAACKPAQDSAQTASSEDGAMTEVLADAGEMRTVAEALTQTGLSGAFEGAGSYTLLAPSDEAFEMMPREAQAIESDEGKAAMAALLRNHMLPGFATRADIAAAIEKANDGEVTMRTMGGNDLTFRKSGSAITVTSPDGVEAQLVGDEVKAGVSNAIAIDRVLVKA